MLYNDYDERRKLHERQRTQGDETRDLKQVTRSIEQIINFFDTIKTIQNTDEAARQSSVHSQSICLVHALPFMKPVAFNQMGIQVSCECPLPKENLTVYFHMLPHCIGLSEPYYMQHF